MIAIYRSDWISLSEVTRGLPRFAYSPYRLTYLFGFHRTVSCSTVSCENAYVNDLIGPDCRCCDISEVCRTCPSCHSTSVLLSITRIRSGFLRMCGCYLHVPSHPGSYRIIPSHLSATTLPAVAGLPCSSSFLTY